MRHSFSRFLRRHRSRKTSRGIRILALIAAANATFAPLARATTTNLYWDPNVSQTGTGTGGTGAWNLTDTHWLIGGTVATGSAAGTETNWTDTTGNSSTGNAGIAEFYGSAGTVTLGSNLGANELIFGTTGYNISGSSTLTLGSGGIINNVGAATINANLSLATETWLVGSSASVTQAGSISNGTLTVAGNGSATFSGSLTSTLGGLNVNTTGSVLINGSTTNSFGGGTGVFANAGTLALDFSNMTTPTNLISSSDSITFGGGSLVITGKNSGATTSQTLNGLNLYDGFGNLTILSNGGSLTNLLLSHNIGRSFIGTGVNFVLPTAGSITAGNSNASGILGGWATVSGTTWATMTAGAVAPYNNSSYVVNTWATGNNTDVTISASVPLGATTNSLRFNTAIAVTLTLSGTNIITSGGILETANVGSNGNLITGGSLEGASGADLIVNQFNTNGGLTIDSLITNHTSATALTLNAPGTVTLTNASNNYSGGTYLNGGTLIISADSNLGAVPASAANNIYFNGGTLNAGGIALATNRSVFVGPSGGTIAGGSTTILGAITGSGTLTANGTTLLNNNSRSFAGSFVANAQTTIYGGPKNAGTDGGSITAAWVANATSGPTYVLVPTGAYGNGVNAVIDMGSLSGISGSEICGMATGDTYTATLMVGNSTSATNTNANTTFAGVISDTPSGTSGSAVVALEKIGANTLTLSGNNTFTGGVILNGGVLSLASPGAIGSSGTISFGLGTSQGVTGTLQYTGTNTSDYSNRFANTASGNSGNQISVDTNSQNVTWATALTSSNGNLTKIGAGTLTLTAAATYTGGTTINGGILALGGGGSLASGVAVNSGGSLAPILKDGNTITVGTAGGNAPVVLNAGSALNLATATAGSGIGTFKIITNSVGLTIGNATGISPILTFNLSTNGVVNLADLINVSGGSVSVGAAGGILDFVVPSGVTSLNSGNYTLINATTGLGTSRLTIGNAATTLDVGLHTYALSLANSTAGSEIVRLTQGADIVPTALYWISNSTNNWTNGNSWSLTPGGSPVGAIPGSGVNAYILHSDAISRIVNYDYTGSATIGAFTIDNTGSQGATNTLQMSGQTFNAGAMNVGTHGVIQGYGTIQGTSLTNAGMMNANQASQALIIYGTPSTNSGTLQATSGGSLVFSTGSINNTGTIQSVGANSQLQFNGATLTGNNGGSIAATGGGAVFINGGTINNFGGTISAIGYIGGATPQYSAVQITSSTIRGGTLQSDVTDSNSVVQLTGNCEFDGSAAAGSFNINGVVTTTAGNSKPAVTLTLAGTIINNGLISDQYQQQTAVLNVKIGDANTNAAMLTGTGALGLYDIGSISGFATGGTSILTNDMAHNIEGGGSSIQNLVLINKGTINSTASTFTLQNILAPVVNSGTLEATGGGTLILNGLTINNSGGTISATGYVGGATPQLSAVQITSSTIRGGTLQSDVTDSNSVVQLTGNCEFDGSAAAGSFNINGVVTTTVGNSNPAVTLTLAGTIINNGGISDQYQQQTAVLNVKIGDANTNAAMLTGTGTLGLYDIGSISGFATGGTSMLTNDTAHYIQGGGSSIQNLVLINKGTINSLVSTFTLQNILAPVVNSGTLEATAGGALILNGLTINNSGGTISATGNSGVATPQSSTVQITSSTIRGGTLFTDANNNSDTVQLTGSCVFDGSTASGSLNISGNVTTTPASSNPVTLTLAGTINNNGQIADNIGQATAPLNVKVGNGNSGAAMLSGTGSLVLSNTNDSLSGTANGGSAILTNDTGHTIQGAGTIANLSLINNGTISANVTPTSGNPSAAMTINVPSIINGGALVANLGGNLSITANVTSSGTIYVGGAGSITPSSITVTGNLTLQSNGTLAEFLYSPGSSSNGHVYVVGNLTINPSEKVSVTTGPGFSTGTYPLAGSSNAVVDVSNNFQNWTVTGASLPANYYYYFSTVSSAGRQYIDLNVRDITHSTPTLLTGTPQGVQWNRTAQYAPGNPGASIQLVSQAGGLFDATATVGGAQTFHLVGATNNFSMADSLNLSTSAGGGVGPVLLPPPPSSGVHNSTNNTTLANLQNNIPNWSSGSFQSTAQLLGPIANVTISNTPTQQVSPYLVEFGYDPTQIPGGAHFELADAQGGIIYVAELFDGGSFVTNNGWKRSLINAIDLNYVVAASARGPFLGSFSELSGTSSNNEASLQIYDGSWGVDTRRHLAWAVVDYDAQFVPVAVNQVPNLTWNNAGASNPTDGNTWDINSNNNWNDGTGTNVYVEGAYVTFNDTNNANFNVLLNTTVRPSSVTVNTAGNYNISGTGIIAGGGSLTKSGIGSLTLSTVNNYSGGTFVNAGTLNLTRNGALPVNQSLNISSGAIVVATNHGANPVNVIVLQLQTFSNAGTLDLTNNDLVIHSGWTVSDVTTQVAAAYNGGAWNGASAGGVITSTTAALDASHLTAIGIATGLTSFESRSVSATDILVKYTYYGDANLDGAVDGSDYSLIDNGYLSRLTGWQNGDFNLDGVIDGSDYTLIDNAFNTQGSTLGTNPLDLIASTTSQIAGEVSAVPEPAALAIAGTGALALLTRRRRNCIASVEFTIAR